MSNLPDAAYIRNLRNTGYIDWTEYSRTIARKRMRWAIRLASKEAKNDPENQ